MPSLFDSAVTSKIASFFSPTKILLQTGAARLVGMEAGELGARRALVITDKGITDAGLIDIVLASIGEAGIEAEVFDQVELEPPVRVVDEVADVLAKGRYDIAIGVGGGSSLDTAKGAAAIAANEGRVTDYVGVNKLPRRGYPKILIPTTAGSGAEMTRVFAVTDEADGAKKVVYSPYNLAEVVILDPAMTVSLPPRITAETGIDALTHAVESYVSAAATPFSDMLGLRSIALITENLPVAFAKGNNIDARYNMLWAASLAGLSWASSGLGAAHAISYVLESACKIGHARAVSIILPHVMEFNCLGNVKKYEQIAVAMREPTERMRPLEGATASATAVKSLIESLGISTNLRDYGATEKDVSILADGVMQHNRLFESNPRNVSVEDVKAILTAAMKE